MECQWKHCTNEARAKGKYCSDSCKNKSCVDTWRKNLKLKAIEYKGSKCSICGYDRCSAALEFHHTDPSIKEFGVGDKGHTRSWERVRTELDKCILVCANCHKELHFGDELAQWTELRAVNARALKRLA